ncbi:Putative transcriptional regulator OS=Tsukamurella paurometabola (strain ATCC 8368 / DSM / CCUG 35730 / CIP 100753 / JCM 10117 / KCTC 9821 / NBRC 16120/ NCIMB 702349 / NCTC 13040) OX=521096 GN=Tpau_1805 PE=4 SV=1 [Tsukamurella paurometabola]|uniref:Putative transcriptional regulator n=1 Tax=Tsukamurella paurometabola (strain ATCC 8368 / DSM 20162 / CCUG 35730 / CIP 100753 / JCM 10117 / KCTC 9821 / NBRC 16120 / NCIMB 702349 / NCTC 13040) TaxID=521096 RepID=D5UME3_TSUPD|nr:QsdR family transcriptional regulator [Tsukamurella paurometabola]ADG78423.1 putative transcriptional regulator [Tsukamurella paurometabola DSM 20162]SUP31577.1 Uncharacterised protein [Tsukamurella paurometabola]
MSHPDRPANHIALIRRAADWFREGRRVDIGQLATDQGVGRATVYRWFDSREQVVGEAIWLGIAQAIARVEADEPIRDRAAFLRAFSRLAYEVRGYPPLARFASDEPEFAMRVLQSGSSVVQERLISWVAGWLDAIDLPRSGVVHGVSRGDLAYAIVRLAESFLWSDMIIGSAPQPDTAASMVELLLRGAETTAQSGRSG